MWATPEKIVGGPTKGEECGQLCRHYCISCSEWQKGALLSHTTWEITTVKNCYFALRALMLASMLQFSVWSALSRYGTSMIWIKVVFSVDHIAKEILCLLAEMILGCLTVATQSDSFVYRGNWTAFNIRVGNLVGNISLYDLQKLVVKNKMQIAM